MTTLKVYRYWCETCDRIIWKPNKEQYICPKCRFEVEAEEWEYSNVFNIPKYIKDNYPDMNLSKSATALIHDMIEGIVMSQIEDCIKIAKDRGNTTILPEHFNWSKITEFQLWLESRRY